MNIFQSISDAIAERQEKIYLKTGRELTPIEWANLLAGQIGKFNNSAKIRTMREAGFPGNNYLLTEETIKTTLATTLADAYIFVDLLADSAMQSIPDSIRGYDKSLLSFEDLSIWLDCDREEIEKQPLEASAVRLFVATGTLIDIVTKRHLRPFENCAGQHTDLKEAIVRTVVGIARVCKKADIDLPVYIEKAFNQGSASWALPDKLDLTPRVDSAVAPVENIRRGF